MDNFSLELSRSIAEHPQFQASYEQLQKESLSSLIGRAAAFERVEARKILRSALIFAQSKDEHFANISQDIVYSLAALSLLTADELLVCQHIMATLGNFPASAFLKHDEESSYSLPWQLQLNEEVRRDGNIVRIQENQILLTDFQVDVWSELRKQQFLSIAAPTSAGKSFLVQIYLRSILSETNTTLNIVYIVPSRSLIHEVQSSLTSAFRSSQSSPIISSVPRVDESLSAGQSRIFVFTQERLRAVMNETDIVPDILIVDEAQQIADDARGMLLLSCLEETHQRNPGTKILFITPGSRSGSPIGVLMGLGELPTVTTSLRPVRQNLIYVDFKSANKQRHLSLTLHKDKHAPLPIGTVELKKNSASTPQARFLTAVTTIGNNGQNLIYAAGKAEAEKIANGIIKSTARTMEPSPRLSDLANFVRRHVHPEYSLANCIEHGIAFHYGSMPTTLTKAIEEYFSQGEIQYLVCTSTLLQGVNLPARNIFIHNPRKGQGKPMGPEDFWNLAGRAGRLSKDTHGNVFLVDYGRWDRKPVEEARQVDVVPSLAKAFKTCPDEVIEYVNNKAHVSGDKKTNFVESVFARLFIDAKEGVLDRTIDRATQGNEAKFAEQIKDAVEFHLDAVSLPAEILKKNAGISPLRQQAMFELLRAAIRGGDVKAHMPPHPMQPTRTEVKERLEYIMSLVHTYLEGKPSRAEKYYGWFSLSWMRGRPLKEMIDFQLRDARLKAKEKGESEPDAKKIIIKVLNEVEKKLRFHYVRYLGCYIDLLKYASSIEFPERELDIPPIPLFLELGACSGTMIACMELGMSRIAAREVTDMLGKSDLDAAVVKYRLQNADLSRSTLSPIIIKEISRLGLILA